MTTIFSYNYNFNFIFFGTARFLVITSRMIVSEIRRHYGKFITGAALVSNWSMFKTRKFDYFRGRILTLKMGKDHLKYLIFLIDLLATCAEGENRWVPGEQKISNATGVWKMTPGCGDIGSHDMFLQWEYHNSCLQIRKYSRVIYGNDYQWRSQHFPEGTPTLLFSILFCRKLRENEKNGLTRGARPCQDPPMITLNFGLIHCVLFLHQVHRIYVSDNHGCGWAAVGDKQFGDRL